MKKLDCPICGVFMVKSGRFGWRCTLCGSRFKLETPVRVWVKSKLWGDK